MMCTIIGIGPAAAQFGFGVQPAGISIGFANRNMALSLNAVIPNSFNTFCGVPSMWGWGNGCNTWNQWNMYSMPLNYFPISPVSVYTPGYMETYSYVTPLPPPISVMQRRATPATATATTVTTTEEVTTTTVTSYPATRKVLGFRR